MRSLVAVIFALAFLVPLATPRAAEAAGLRRVKKVKTSGGEPGAGKHGISKRGATSHRGLTGVFKARQPGQKSAMRQKLGRVATRARKAVTFDRVVRTQVGILKFGSTVTFGMALGTGRPSVIVMAGVMTAAAYALGPAMKLAEKIGERIGERMLARSDARGG